jgi:hypothetical protein
LAIDETDNAFDAKRFLRVPAIDQNFCSRPARSHVHLP